MAAVPKPKGDEIKNKISIHNQTFLLTIHKSEETHTLYLGGAHTYCISVIILMPGSIYERFTDISICTLDHYYYHELCSLSGGFRRGVDVQRIFNIIFSYINDNYKHIKTIQLKDFSTRTCDNNTTMNLYEKYYITKGITWYQSKYKAYLNEKESEKFKKADIEFQKKKKEISYDTMKRFMTNVPNNAEKYYEESETWKDFFSSIENSMGVAKFCEFISPWISTFLLNIMNYDFTAPYNYIDIKNISYLNYKQEGGSISKKNYTRSKKMFASKISL